MEKNSNISDFIDFSFADRDMTFEEIYHLFKNTKIIPKLQKILCSGEQKKHISNQSLNELSFEGMTDFENKLLNNMLLHGIASSFMLYPCLTGDFKAIPVWLLNYLLYLIQCYNIARIETLKCLYQDKKNTLIDFQKSNPQLEKKQRIN